MRSLLYRLFFGRVSLRIQDFSDRRTQELKDAHVYLDFARGVNARVASKERARTVRIGADPFYIPAYIREELPSILRRQAA